MALNQVSSVVLDNTDDKKQVKYLNKDFSEFKRSLIEFTKFYYPDDYQDFSDASPGSIFIDMASYVGDVLSYYTDYNFKESLLAYAQERENVVSIAQGFGYTPKVVAPSFCNASLSVLVPATADGNVDTKYLPKVARNSTFTPNVQSTAGVFLLDEVCDFADARNREIVPFSVDDVTGEPISFVITKQVKLIAATERSFDYDVTSPEKFLKVELPDERIVDISSVVDDEGNTWYEVDNLSQDYRFQDVLIQTTPVISGSYYPSSAMYRIRPVKTNRRFVKRLNRDLRYELIFGSGTGDLSDVFENMDYKSVYNENYLQNMTNVALDTLNFTNSNSFGLAPGNTTLTIKYRVASGLNSNVPAGTITNVSNLNVLNETRTFTTPETNTFNQVISSATIINDEPARGGINDPTTEQIRQEALGYISAQSRTVTAQDYQSRVLSMPSKYGSVAKSFVVSDDAINAITSFSDSGSLTLTTLDPEDDILYVPDSPVNNNVNLYVLGYDQNKRLTTLNNTVKNNILDFLKGYRMLTDRINILDAFRVSIGVKYSIIVYKGFNTYDVLAQCSDRIAKYFDTDKWSINQPIVIDDVLLEIAKVNGVQSVPNLEITNKYQQRDGSDYAPWTYDVAINGPNVKNRVIYPSADPCIFELRYPQDDIIGTAIQ